jgi:hypothetical protein
MNWEKMVEIVFGGLIALGIINVLVRQSSQTPAVIGATGTAGSQVFGALTKA